jgi:YVTN family beta-propeller protein
MRSRIVVALLLVATFASLYLLNSCKHSPFPAPAAAGNGNYPDSIASIFITKCAITGCHDASGYVNAANLRLDTWENLFKGSSSGAEVIPYNPKYSSLLYFINTDSTRGLVVPPTMPYNYPPLSDQEYNTIKNWIAAGAPDKNGNIPFASNPDTRQKIYLTQQGCDLMAVIDGASGVIMRIFPIGISGSTEAPHSVHFTQDGRYAYVSYAAGTATQKIDANTDTVIATINLPDNGGIVNISPDGEHVMVSTYIANGQLYDNNFNNLSYTGTGPNTFNYPHGIASTPNWDTFYVTSQYGNVVYRYVPGKIPPIIKLPLDTTQPTVVGTGGLYSDPHEIIMTPDHSKFFVSCQNTNEVRVLDAHTYKVLAVIPVGAVPQEFAIAPSKHELFVSCIYDEANPNPGCKGSVYVIDYNSLQLVGGPIYGDFYEPHGIAVDEQNNNLYVVSSNVTTTGPPPHHVSECGSTAGWYSIYDLTTLQPRNHFRYQTTNAPYSADTRFR